MRLHRIVFGCQMSAADGDAMGRAWLARGASYTDDLQDADAVLLNTCTVRGHAEQRTLSLIGRLAAWKAGRPGRLLVVAGCVAERLGERLRERFPHVDLAVGSRSVGRFPELLDSLLASRAGPPSEAPPASPTAFITVLRGCNQSCAYCIVPAVRGPEVSRSVDEVLREIAARVEEGAREAMLLGQTVNSYRAPEGRTFADLLRAVQGIEGLERIRYMSAHPAFLDEAAIRAVAECPKVCPHLHLPAQSGSDRVLRAMGRDYTRAEFLERIGRLRRLVPDLAVTSDLLTGFPGETEQDFRETLSLVEEADFCTAYCFKYSPREGTASAALPETADEALKDERLARLLESVERRMDAHLKAMAGRRVRVLLETPTDGRTQYHFRARLSSPGVPGTIVEAEVSGSTRTALKCR